MVYLRFEGVIRDAPDIYLRFEGLIAKYKRYGNRKNQVEILCISCFGNPLKRR